MYENLQRIIDEMKTMFRWGPGSRASDADAEPWFEYEPRSVSGKFDRERNLAARNARYAAMGMGFPTFPNGMPKTAFLEWLESEVNDAESRRALHRWGCIDLDTGNVVEGCPHPELREEA